MGVIWSINRLMKDDKLDEWGMVMINFPISEEKRKKLAQRCEEIDKLGLDIYGRNYLECSKNGETLRLLIFLEAIDELRQAISNR